jgi:pimeloyl-ACP methyl ester carboxylesterase
MNATGSGFVRQPIDIGGALIDVTLPAAHDGLLIATAHPADALDQATAALLGAAAGKGVVCVNPRGLGRSSPRPAVGRGTLEEMTDEIESARQRLGLPPWVFWGMSGGGWLGQIYAQRHPRALAGLILESICPCFRLRLADPDCLLSPFHPAWREKLAAAGLIADGSHAQVGDPMQTEWTEVAELGAVFRRRNGPALLVAPFPIAAEMRAVMPALWVVDTRAGLPRLRLPTLVLCGSADPVVPVAHARALQEAIPDARLVVIEGGGHVPVSERRPEVAEAVARFLRERFPSLG